MSYLDLSYPDPRYFGSALGRAGAALQLFAPGAPPGRYFEEVGGLGEPTAAERAEFLVRHDSYVVE